MVKLLFLSLSLAVAVGAGVLPYPIHKKTLPNGLDIIVIEAPEFKGVLSYNTLVLAGSGKEQEKGKTGLAHLFEHILFRHRFGGRDGGYDEQMSRLGTHNNAWTWFDVTYYHPLTFSASLESRKSQPGLAELEASRFVGLDFTEKTFKTEAGAVLGEYRRTASFPSEKLAERLYALMFPGHPYGHTTIGYLEDVKDMPSHYQAARSFYETYYRPNNCVLVAAGDVKADDFFRRVEPFYKDWKPGVIPAVPPQAVMPRGDSREHVVWDADVAPLIWVSYRMPAFSPGTPDSAVGQLLGELLVSPAAPLYRRLRYEKQAASAVGLEDGVQGFESFDPRVLTVSAQLFKDKYAAKGRPYFDEVSADVIAGVEGLADFSRQEGAEELLARVKSKYRYDFLAQFASPEKIASVFAWYYRFHRDPEVLDKLLKSVEAVSPGDIDRFARTYFKPEGRSVLSLAYEPGPKKEK